MPKLIVSLFLCILAATSAVASGDDPPVEAATPPPDPDAVVATFEARCQASAEARAARHADTPLYERLGADEGIHRLTKEIVRLHLQNEAIAHLFDGLDYDRVAERVALFIIAGTGGPGAYEGPSLADSHRAMHLSNADFVAAGGDVIQAMENLEYGPEEIDEMVCTLVALRPQVVLTEQEAGTAAAD